MPQIFARWQAEYAARGLATFPVDPIADGGKTKKPYVKHYNKIGLRASQQLALRFLDTNGLGCMAGARNRLTLIDIDARGAEADRLTANAQCMYGRSHFIVRTGRDGRHLYYRHNGEARKIRPNPTCPIDILGGGVVVLPPSLGAEQCYAIVEGHLDDLVALTTIKNAPTRADGVVPPDIPPIPGIPRDLTGMRDGDARNNALFGIMRRVGHRLPPTIEAFIEYAREQNARCAEPMSDDRVIRTARSVFKYRERGTLWSGGVVTIDHADIDGLMMENPDAFLLYSFLQRHHWGREFALANETAARMPGGGWTRKRLAAARAALIEADFLTVVCPARINPSRRPMICRLRR